MSRLILTASATNAADQVLYTDFDFNKIAQYQHIDIEQFVDESNKALHDYVLFMSDSQKVTVDGKIKAKTNSRRIKINDTLKEYKINQYEQAISDFNDRAFEVTDARDRITKNVIKRMFDQQKIYLIKKETGGGGSTSYKSDGIREWIRRGYHNNYIAREIIVDEENPDKNWILKQYLHRLLIVVNNHEIGKEVYRDIKSTLSDNVSIAHYYGRNENNCDESEQIHFYFERGHYDKTCQCDECQYKRQFTTHKIANANIVIVTEQALPNFILSTTNEEQRELKFGTPATNIIYDEFNFQNMFTKMYIDSKATSIVKNTLFTEIDYLFDNEQKKTDEYYELLIEYRPIWNDFLNNIELMLNEVNNKENPDAQVFVFQDFFKLDKFNKYLPLLDFLKKAKRENGKLLYLESDYTDHNGKKVVPFVFLQTLLKLIYHTENFEGEQIQGNIYVNPATKDDNSKLEIRIKKSNMIERLQAGCTILDATANVKSFETFFGKENLDVEEIYIKHNPTTRHTLVTGTAQSKSENSQTSMIDDIQDYAELKFGATNEYTSLKIAVILNLDQENMLKKSCKKIEHENGDIEYDYTDSKYRRLLEIVGGFDNIVHFGKAHKATNKFEDYDVLINVVHRMNLIEAKKQYIDVNNVDVKAGTTQKFDAYFFTDTAKSRTVSADQNFQEFYDDLNFANQYQGHERIRERVLNYKWIISFIEDATMLNPRIARITEVDNLKAARQRNKAVNAINKMMEEKAENQRKVISAFYNEFASFFGKSKDIHEIYDYVLEENTIHKIATKLSEKINLSVRTIERYTNDANFIEMLLEALSEICEQESIVYDENGNIQTVKVSIFEAAKAFATVIDRMYTADLKSVIHDDNDSLIELEYTDIGIQIAS